LTQSGEAMANGVQRLSREWFDLVQARLQGNLEDMVRLARSRTWSEFVAAQGNLVRHNLEMMMDNAQRLVRRSLRVADAAKEPLAADM
jgi:hypothetical protein